MPTSLQWKKLKAERASQIRKEFSELLAEGDNKTQALAKLAVKYGVSFNTIYNDIKNGGENDGNGRA